jgi:hypothetical protein
MFGSQNYDLVGSIPQQQQRGPPPYAHGMPEQQSFAFESAPPPRCAPAADGGAGTFTQQAPPPREAPHHAAQAASRGGGGGSRAGGGQFVLKVLTSDNRWEQVAFSPGDRLEQVGSSFLSRTGLKGAFQAGLVSKMRTMISSGQAQSSVDIVDLI